MADDRHVFKASRLTAGNFWFPVRIEVTPDRVARIKPRLVGSSEESIAISKIASISIVTGFLFAGIRIDSTGGTSPILSNGHWASDARRMRDLIERYQKEAAARHGG